MLGTTTQYNELYNMLIFDIDYMFMYIFQLCPFVFYCHMERYDECCPSQPW